MPKSATNARQPADRLNRAGTVAEHDVDVRGRPRRDGQRGAAAARAARRARRSGSSASRPATTAAPRTAAPASSGSAISSIRPTCRCCAGPTSSGASSRRRRGRKLMHITGIAEIGPPDGTRRARARCSRRARTGCRTRCSTRGETDAAVSGLSTCRTDYVGVFQPDGGFLAVEPAIEAQLALATAAGAEIRTGETRARGRRRARTAFGSKPIAHASRPRSRDRRRRAVGEASCLPELAAARDAPGHGLVRAARSDAVRGRPLPGVPAREPARRALRLSAARQPGVKIAKHHHRDETVDPGRDRPRVSAADEALIRARARRSHSRRRTAALIAAKTCLYTVTPDDDFIIDRAAGRAERHRRLALLRPRLQVRAGDRRNPGRSRDSRARRGTTFRVSAWTDSDDRSPSAHGFWNGQGPDPGTIIPHRRPCLPGGAS